MNIKEIYRKLSSQTWFCILFSLWYLLNLVQGYCTDLADDEAYYYFYSQHLAWGYFDHPPMLALLIKLGYTLFHNELGVRFFIILLQPFYLWLIWDMIKPSHFSKRQVTAYFLICFSIPLMQLYGFVAVPDAPLLFFSALFLWSYHQFCKNDSWSVVFLMAFAIAALAYSKYHGALVVFFVLLSNLKIFRNYNIYMVGLIAFLLILPHLYWQYTHEWITFQYHLIGRNSGFNGKNVLKYGMNLVLVFNPFLLPILIKSWRKVWKSNALFKAYSYMMIGFVVFFAYNSLYKEIQAQWMIPLSFCVISFIFTYVIQNEKAMKYVNIAGIISLFFFLLVRIYILFFPLGNNTELYKSQETYHQLYDAVEGNPVVFMGHYQMASKYRFYTKQEAYAQSNVFYRQTQFDLEKVDEKLLGKKVAVQTWNTGRCVTLPNKKKFYFQFVEKYQPTKDVKVYCDPLPETVRNGTTLHARIRLYNPYSAPLRIDDSCVKVVLYLIHKSETPVLLPVEGAIGEIPAKNSKFFDVSWSIPQEMKKNSYQMGFSVQAYPSHSWINGKTLPVRVVTSNETEN